VTGICVKHRNDLGLGLPVRDVVRDELEVKNGRRQVPFERQVSDAEGNPKVIKLRLRRLGGSRDVPTADASFIASSTSSVVTTGATRSYADVHESREQARRDQTAPLRVVSGGRCGSHKLR
jgi:hypothetical protein